MEDAKKTKLPEGYYTACGGRIDDPSRYPSVKYHGREVYFCNKACLSAYLADPDGFMAGEIDHPLEQNQD